MLLSQCLELERIMESLSSVVGEFFHRKCKSSVQLHFFQLIAHKLSPALTYYLKGNGVQMNVGFVSNKKKPTEHFI